MSEMKVGCPTAKSFFNIHNRIGLKFLTSLRLCLSHLNVSKFKQFPGLRKFPVPM